MGSGFEAVEEEVPSEARRPDCQAALRSFFGAARRCRFQGLRNSSSLYWNAHMVLEKGRTPRGTAAADKHKHSQ